MDLPFLTSEKLAKLLELEKRTLLDHLVRKYPEQAGMPECPHRKLGGEYYFVLEDVRLWLKGESESG